MREGTHLRSELKSAAREVTQPTFGFDEGCNDEAKRSNIIRCNHLVIENPSGFCFPVRSWLITLRSTTTNGLALFAIMQISELDKPEDQRLNMYTNEAIQRVFKKTAFKNDASIGVKYDDDFGDRVTIPAIAAVCTAVRHTHHPVSKPIDAYHLRLSARVHHQGVEDRPLHPCNIRRIHREQGYL